MSSYLQNRRQELPTHYALDSKGGLVTSGGSTNELSRDLVNKLQDPNAGLSILQAKLLRGGADILPAGDQKSKLLQALTNDSLARNNAQFVHATPPNSNSLTNALMQLTHKDSAPIDDGGHATMLNSRRIGVANTVDRAKRNNPSLGLMGLVGKQQLGLAAALPLLGAAAGGLGDAGVGRGALRGAGAGLGGLAGAGTGAILADLLENTAVAKNLSGDVRGALSAAAPLGGGLLGSILGWQGAKALSKSDKEKEKEKAEKSAGFKDALRRKYSVDNMAHQAGRVAGATAGTIGGGVLGSAAGPAGLIGGGVAGGVGGAVIGDKLASYILSKFGPEALEIAQTEAAQKQEEKSAALRNVSLASLTTALRR